MTCRVEREELAADRELDRRKDERAEYISKIADYLTTEMSTQGEMKPHVLRAEDIIKEAVFNEVGDSESIINAAAIISLTDQAQAGRILARLMREQILAYAQEHFHTLVRFVEE
jgi:hypothetical protein